MKDFSLGKKKDDLFHWLMNLKQLLVTQSLLFLTAYTQIEIPYGTGHHMYLNRKLYQHIEYVFSNYKYLCS